MPSKSKAQRKATLVAAQDAVSASPDEPLAAQDVVSASPQEPITAQRVVPAAPDEPFAAQDVVSASPQEPITAQRVVPAAPDEPFAAQDVVSASPQELITAQRVVSAAPEEPFAAQDVVSASPQEPITAQRVVSAAPEEDERQFEAALRPTALADFAGQKHVREQLEIAIEAAKRRGEAMDHVLLCGPPGLGKTTLAGIIANELSVPIDQTAAPVLQRKLDLTGILSTVRDRQVFFIDEIHRLLPDIEETLYSALEDFRLDILIGTGPGARTHSLPLPHFTAVGATTRQGLLSAPLRSRFGIVLRLDPYDEETLGRIVERSAKLLDTAIEPDAAREIARRGRGTPRIANRLLRRVRDYAQVRAQGRIEYNVAEAALNLLKVDRYGLDDIDQKIMRTVLEKYRGGPVSVGTIAVSVDEQADTIIEVYEPYLIQLGLLDRTPRGRIATDHAFEYFGIRNPRPPPSPPNPFLF